MRTPATHRRPRTTLVALGAALVIVGTTAAADPVGAAAKAKTTKAKAARSSSGGSTGATPSLRLDPADRDLAGIVPALPTVPGFLTGRTGSAYFAVHLRGYQGVQQRLVILGLEEESDGPCVRFDDSGGFSFATTLPGGIAWDPVRGTSNAAYTTYRAIVHNWRNHYATGCETQKWDDTGAAIGSLAVRFEPNRIRIESFGVGAGVECKGGCPSGWNRLLGDEVVLTAAQKAALADPKVPEVVIPFRYRDSFTDDSPGVEHPCYEDEVQREDIDCTWTGASLAYLHLIRLGSQAEFGRIVQASANAAIAMAPKGLGGGGAAGVSAGGGAIPASGIGSPLVGSVPCAKEPERRRCMPVQ